MQDRYVGDIGDFAKFGLLRALTRDCSGGPLQLGVIWYRVPDEVRSTDGRHIDYLTNAAPRWQRLRDLDPPLAGTLRDLVRSGKRLVGDLEKACVLPKTTRYYSRPLSFGAIRGAEARARVRRDWVVDGQKAVRSTDIVFLDPDTGIETDSIDRLSAQGPKYAYRDDLLTFSEPERSLVVYQHAHRRVAFPEQVEGRLRQLASWLPGREPFALRFRRVSPRAFLVVPAAEHVVKLRRKALTFLASGWDEHFDPVGL